MEATLISMVFMLVFWGGLVFFLGEAIILSFKKGQDLLLQRISVFSHHEYYKENVFRKVGRILVFSDLKTKVTLWALVCVYAVLCAQLISVADSSLTILEKMVHMISASHR